MCEHRSHGNPRSTKEGSNAVATNGFDGIRRQLEEFDATLAAFGISIPPKAPIRRYLELVREFLADHAASPDAAAEKWLKRDMHDWYKAMIAVDVLTEAVTGVGTQPAKAFQDQIALVVANDISQDFEPTQSKDFLYELQVATWFGKMGFDVTLAEPDVRIRGQGLTGEFGLACKYPSSEKKLNQRISEGYDQIERQQISGIVVIGMDLLVCEGMTRFIEFPNDEAKALRIVANELGQRVERVKRQREGVKDRKPLDGALFTLHMGGHMANSGRLQTLTQFTFQCDSQSPLMDSISAIMKQVPRLRMKGRG